MQNPGEAPHTAPVSTSNPGVPHANTPHTDTPYAYTSPGGPNQSPPKKSKCCLFAGIGCGVVVLLLAALVGLAVFAGGDKIKSASSQNSSSEQADEAATQAALSRYVGQWTGADGTRIWIRGDGKGDYNGGNTKVTGGGVTINEKSQKLAITSFFGIGKTWKLTSPAKSKDGQTEMTLDGMVYRRTGGFNPNTNGSTPSDDAEFNEAAPPAVTEQKRLIKETLTQFDEALGKKDFTAFHKYCSQMWQSQITPAKFREIFKEFISRKIRLNGVLQTMQPSITSAQIEDGLLVLRGNYASSPNKTYFKLRYLPENEQWKLISIHVKIGIPITD